MPYIHTVVGEKNPSITQSDSSGMIPVVIFHIDMCRQKKKEKKKKRKPEKFSSV